MYSAVKTINILGATGSIGRSAADVILAQPQIFDVQVVTANTSARELAAMAVKLNAKHAVLAEASGLAALESALLDTGIRASAGQSALIDAARMPAAITLAAIVGMAGLAPLMAAIEHSSAVAIANKEPLVAAGPLVMEAARAQGTKILPVDSEHNAIFQVFDSRQPEDIERLILTASGGPFLSRSYEEMRRASPQEALAHPNWSMGDKISIDSATMMNKALEVIEAHYLFDMPADKIDVLVHPQSVVHSMVEYKDGSVLAQLGPSDMRTPIANVLAWPQRLKTPGKTLDFKTIGNLSFEAPDAERFPFIRMAYDVLEAGPWACVTMNAANEVAVAAFLNTSIGFTDIMEHVARALSDVQPASLSTLEDVYSLDRSVRALTERYITSNQTHKAAKAS